MRYVALGDSYTIGTGVDPADAWPSQLAARLPPLRLEANLGVNGFSTDDLLAFELPDLQRLEPEFVTILIGVNDVVRGVPEATYAANVERILRELLARVPERRVVAVATPDYTVTPMGRAFDDPSRRRATVARFNEILGSQALARDVAWVPDIFEISQAAASDRAQLADDGLHPSARQYALWVDAIEPVVRARLSPAPSE
jgi:acyl-CoA thioesterase I